MWGLFFPSPEMELVVKEGPGAAGLSHISFLKQQL